jgi:hypothetical protein
VYSQEQGKQLNHIQVKKWEIEARGEYDSEEGNSSMLKCGDSVYFISVMKFDEKGKTFFNFSTPYAVFGKVKGKGLLREIKNPASHSPGSSIFTEKTEVASDKIFESSGNCGIRLSAGECFSVFNEISSSETGTLDWSGAYGRYKINEWLVVSCAAAKYTEKDDSESEVWYTEQRTGYGRKVMNSAFSVSAGKNTAGAGAAAALTSCHGTPSGYFYRFSPYLALSFIRIDLLVSGTNESYIKPDGTLPSSGFRKGVNASFFPVSILKLTGRFVSDIYHEKYSDKNYCAYSDETSAVLVFDPAFLIFKTGLSDKNMFKDDVLENTQDAWFSAGIKSRNCKIIIEKKERYIDKEKYSDSTRVEAGIRNKLMNIYLLGKLFHQADTEKSIKAHLTIHSGGVSVFGEFTSFLKEDISGKGDNYSEYSTGFKVKY